MVEWVEGVIGSFSGIHRALRVLKRISGCISGILERHQCDSGHRGYLFFNFREFPLGLSGYERGYNVFQGEKFSEM